MDADTESYILLLLSDGNLPTGSFIASSGLEAYEKHGFFRLSSSQNGQVTGLPPAKTDALISFMRDSVQTYAHSSLPFVLAVHDACDTLQSHGNAESALSDALETIARLDNVCEATTLNHVARRASTAQGVALLTLLMKGLVPPTWVGTSDPGKKRVEAVADSFKLEIRRGTVHGHLPVCWGVLTAALGLSPSELSNNLPTFSNAINFGLSQIGRSQYLFLFLHARSLLSAAIRLNSIGPYAAQQLLLHIVRPLVQAALKEAGALRIHFTPESISGGSCTDPIIEDGINDGPAVTWPLGEILAARHDQQHSRIFNS